MKTYIIISMENEHSLEKGLECIDQAHKFNIKPEIFKAVKGEDAQDVFDKFGLTHVLKSACALDKLKRNGVRGCLASHLLLLEKCKNDNVPYLIMEHDAWFLKNLPEDILENFKDVIHLDGFDHLSKTYYQNTKNHENENLKYINYTEIRKIQDVKYRALTGKEGIRYTYFFGTHAYIIKPHAVDVILDYLKRFGLVPADWMFNNYLFPDLKGVNTSLVCVYEKYNSNYVRENNLSLTC